MFTFKMTAASYRRGCVLRMRKNRARLPGTASLIMALLVFFAVLIIRADMFFFALPLIFVGMALYEVGAYSRAVSKEFEKMPYLHGVQKCTLLEDGLELQNSFEKLFVKYADVYAVKNRKSYILLLPTFSKGVIFLDKKENEKEAKELLEALEKGGVKI